MSWVASLCGSTVGTVVKPIWDTIWEHATYPCTAGRNVRDLESATQTFVGIREDVVQQRETGVRHGLIATIEAVTWLSRADNAIAEEGANRERYEQRCKISGCCFPNCWSSYKISKKAAKTLVEVNWCRDHRPANVTVVPPPQAVVQMNISCVPQPSQQVFLGNTLQCIADVQLGMIGIWGPPCVGKTLHLKMINNSFDAPENPFNFVIYLTASRECTVQEIQSQILNRLRMGDGDSVTNNNNQAERIREYLVDKSFLVLLDGLRNHLDLAAVGLPHPLGTQGQLQRKVVIEADSLSLCHRMNVNKDMQVPALQEGEALQLFKDNFGDENLYSDPGIGALARDLVQLLRARPSDLTIVGKAMQGKREPVQWERAIGTVRNFVHFENEEAFQTARNVRRLEEGVEKLCARMDDVRHRIKLGEKNGKVATHETNMWLSRVDAIISKGQVICNSGYLNLGISVAAEETFGDIAKCLNEQPREIEVDALPPSVQQIDVSSEQKPSRVKKLQEAIQCIKDDHSEGVIGIWGQGGVGKTHLLKQINDSLHGDSFFDYVIFVTASKECSVEKIQDEIVKRLSLPKVDDVKSTIFNFLSKRSFLLLLDDIWEPIDLQEVGIPTYNPNQIWRKVVITTRFLREVCGKMEVRKCINVDYLPDDEAWQLFQDKVGLETLSSPGIESPARVLVKELKGLPLALIVIGRAMYSKTDPEEWISAIDYMTQSCCDKDDPLYMETVSIFKKLKFSYDSLQSDTIKQCFLTCSLWPEDAKISMNDLVKCWTGLGLVSLGKVHTIVGALKAACLLESGENSSSTICYFPYLANRKDHTHQIMPDAGYVKMHDVVRDMAIWISRDCGENNDKWVVHAGVGANIARNIPWGRAEFISLMRNGIKQLPPVVSIPNSTKLTSLFLQNNKLDQNVFRAIQSCTALKYLDLSWNELLEIPDELCALVNLEYLNLSCNRQIYKVPLRLGKLNKLKFLYLGGTRIKMLPMEVILCLKDLQILDLITNECRQQFDATSMIQGLCKLTKLRVVDIVIRSDAEYELLSVADDPANMPIRDLILSGLKEKSVFSDEIARKTLRELHIHSCNMKQIIVEELATPFDALKVLVLDYLDLLEKIIWKRTPQAFFPSLTHLHLFCCNSLRHLSWAMYLPCLQYLCVHRADNMEQLILSTDNPDANMPMGQGSSTTSVHTFPYLKRLDLRTSPKLAILCDPVVTFPSLENMQICRYPNLRRLPFTMQSLPPKLERLEIDSVREWNKLEWEEEGVKSSLQRIVKFRLR